MKEHNCSECRFAFPVISPNSTLVYNCCRQGLSNVQTNISAEYAQACPHFKHKNIQYPITVNKLDLQEYEYNQSRAHCDDIGKLCIIRLCEDEYKDKTFVGIFLGDLPMAPYIKYNEETHILKFNSMTHPAIFVPELKKIIFGAESWWSIINDESDFKDISDETINSQWYMFMLKEIAKKGNTEK